MREPFLVCLRPAWLALTLFAFTGCETDLSDFDLQIVPRVLEGQDPFATSPELKLFLSHEDGTSEILYLGPAGAEQTEFGGIPPLEDGTVVGLVLEEPGGNPSSIDLTRLLAYGRARLDQDLATGGQQAELPMVVPQVAALGGMGRLGPKQAVHAPALAMTPGGSVYLFGGDELPGTDGAVDRILVLRDADAGEWSFERIDTTLPEPLAAMNAVTVEVDGEPRILLSGGRPEFGSSGSNSVDVLLFDPQTEEIVWGLGRKHAKLPVGRSGHSSVTLADGTIFFYGGLTGTSGLSESGTWAIFDPSTLEFTHSGTSSTGPLGAAAAPLGSSGVLMCGGGRPDSTHASYTAVADCTLISLQGKELPAPALPEPLAHLAMTALPDGTVLATGGIQGTLATDVSFEIVPAVAKAWVFDGTSWKQVGSMGFPRAEHVLIPTPSGKVVVVGGVEQTGFFFAGSGPAVTCTETYDPVARAFSTVGSTCVEAGSGARPVWATAPGEDAFVLEGTVGQQLSTAPDAFGLVGLGPDLQRP